MKQNRKISIISNTCLTIASLLALLPFLLLIIASLTDNNWAIANGFSYFPGKWSLDAYLYLTSQAATIGRAYVMTILSTAVGTALSILVTSLFAYGLNNDQIPGIRLINLAVVFTMLFNGGLVATYYTYNNIFHIKDTFWALIFPNLMMNAFNIILVKNYFRGSIPDSLVEAARIDGASEFSIFFKIVFPLSKPIMATVGLMTGLMYWNDWQNGLYYLTQRNGSKFYTIQVVLNTINENISFLSSSGSSGAAAAVSTMPSATARMAIAVVGILPVLVIYPFFQKYFVKGIMLGGVKG
ncbi:MAG: carbohydrate ABC transporter permease [Eubacteriales bacterium]|nr:carbohydrate ABC transporter permease [Eubacteriales bacterium]